MYKIYTKHFIHIFITFKFIILPINLLIIPQTSSYESKITILHNSNKNQYSYILYNHFFIILLNPFYIYSNHKGNKNSFTQIYQYANFIK
jgi:hypothetical protein